MPLLTKVIRKSRAVELEVQGRHHDRDSPFCPAVTADEIAREARVLLLRHQRPDPDDLRLLRRDDAGNVPRTRTTTRRSTTPIPSPRLDQQRRRQARSDGRQARPVRRPARIIKLGICGEHGGDPSSVMFCHKVGLNYVSCSPFRVPIARLAAAHAAILEKQGQL